MVREKEIKLEISWLQKNKDYIVNHTKRLGKKWGQKMFANFAKC
jgi:hypothetical protein